MFHSFRHKSVAFLSGLLPEAGTWLWHCVTGFPFPLVDITKEQQLVQSAFLKEGKKVYVHMRSGGTLSMEISYLFEKKDVRK